MSILYRARTSSGGVTSDRPGLWLAGALVVIAAACSPGSPEPAMTGGTTDDRFEAALGCDGLADRWATLHQEYLDRLGTATAAELAEPSPAVSHAGRWLANAMIEQTRDAGAVGCTELVSGSDALCARIDGLVAGGDAGETVLKGLRSSCG